VEAAAVVVVVLAAAAIDFCKYPLHKTNWPQASALNVIRPASVKILLL
jgi:hypothetical protein